MIEEASFEIIDREAWLESHRQYIGGSGISAAAGLNKYKTPLALYLFMKGEIEDTAGVKARMGTCLEPLLREMFWEETGLRVIPAPILRHPDYDFLGANPDGGIEDEETSMFEGKTFDFTTEDSWGEPGTDSIPREHFMQCQFYMGMWGKRKCFVGALHRTTGRFGVYVIRFDPEVYELLVAAGVKFYREHIEPGIPPAPEAGDLDYLRDKYPTDTGGIMIADAEMEGYASAMQDAYRQIQPLKQVFDTNKARFMDRMAENSLCETMVGQFTYRQAKEKKVVDYKAALTLLCADPAASPETVITACTTTKAGSRRFLNPFSKDE